MKDEISRKYIEETKPNSFEYGKNDCALWAFKYIKLLNGVDLVSKYLGKYKTWSGGRSALRKYGDKSLIEYLDDNFMKITPPYAQRGDLVMLRGALGLCQGRLTYFLNKKGVAHRYTLDCKFGWRVEEKCRK